MLNHLQPVFLFLELLGIFLAWLEINYPKASNDIEEVILSLLYIIHFLEQIVSLISGNGFKHMKFEELKESYHKGSGSRLLITLFWLVVFISLAFQKFYNDSFGWMIFFIVMTFGTLLMIIPDSIIYFNKIKKDRGLGLLGIVIASIGFLWNATNFIISFFS